MASCFHAKIYLKKKKSIFIIYTILDTEFMQNQSVLL